MEKTKQKIVSVDVYSKKMNDVIVKYQDKPIDDCLVALLEEASKYQIIGRQ